MSAQITLTGRLVADPEMKFAANGNAIANMRVVTSGRRKTDEGWQDVDTTFWSVAAFRQLAENCAESLSKGDLVVVTGKVKSREWQDKEGNKRVSWEVAADHVAVDLVRNTAKSSRVARSPEPAADDPWSNSGMVPVDNDVAPF